MNNDSKNDKNLSVEIMKAVEPLLPKGTGFIMICVSSDDQDFGITSNVSDKYAVLLLEDAIASIETTPSEDLVEKDTPLN